MNNYYDKTVTFKNATENNIFELLQNIFEYVNKIINIQYVGKYKIFRITCNEVTYFKIRDLCEKNTLFPIETKYNRLFGFPFNTEEDLFDNVLRFYIGV